MRRLLRWSISPNDRSIFDVGNLMKPALSAAHFHVAPLAALFRREQRLQLGLADSSMLQEAEFLKAGSTALVLEMVEAGALDDAPRLRRPIQALHAIVSDPNLETRVETDRGLMSALEIQRFYFERACEFVRDLKTTSIEALQVTEIWGQVLSAFERRDMSSLIGRIDWVTKRYLLEACGDPRDAALLKTIDLRYHELGEGYAARLERSGFGRRLVSERRSSARLDARPRALRPSPGAGSSAAGSPASHPSASRGNQPASAAVFRGEWCVFPCAGEDAESRAMPGNSFGQAFRITTAGESHGPSYVVIVDGMPPGLELSEADLKPDLDRRRPGQSKVTTQRDESDEPSILSGVFEGRTTGTPIAVAIQQPRPALAGLQRDPGEISSRPRGLHVRRQVRLPRLPGRRPLERAGDGGARRRGRDREEASPSSLRDCDRRLREAGRRRRRPTFPTRPR